MESTHQQGTGITAKPQENKALTFGESLVGLNFNPSNDDKVGQAMKLFAQIADLVKEQNVVTSGAVGGGFGQAELANILYNHTIGEILNAQMNVVKVLTLKY